MFSIGQFLLFIMSPAKKNRSESLDQFIQYWLKNHEDDDFILHSAKVKAKCEHRSLLLSQFLIQ